MQPVDTYITLMAKNFGFSIELNLIIVVFSFIIQDWLFDFFFSVVSWLQEILYLCLWKWKVYLKSVSGTSCVWGPCVSLLFSLSAGYLFMFLYLVCQIIFDNVPYIFFDTNAYRWVWGWGCYTPVSDLLLPGVWWAGNLGSHFCLRTWRNRSWTAVSVKSCQFLDYPSRFSVCWSLSPNR